MTRADRQRERRHEREAARRLMSRSFPQRFAEMPFGALWNQFTGQCLSPQSCLNQDHWPQWARRAAEPVNGLGERRTGKKSAYADEWRLKPLALTAGA